MTALPSRPTLRLADTEAASAATVSPGRNSVAASRTAPQRRIHASDARWALAVRTAALMEGGRVGLLRPENRRRVLETAKLLGLRAFDANLIIAIVQDAARTGDDPLGGEVQSRLQMVAPANAFDKRRESIFTACAIAATLAVILGYALCKWVAAGGTPV